MAQVQDPQVQVPPATPCRRDRPGKVVLGQVQLGEGRQVGQGGGQLSAELVPLQVQLLQFVEPREGLGIDRRERYR